MPIELPHLTGLAPHVVEQAILRLRDGIEEYNRTLQKQIAGLPTPLTLDQIRSALAPTGTHPLQTTSALNTVPPPTSPSPTPQPPDNPTPGPYNATIDGYSVIIYNSPDVTTWTETTTLTAIDLDTDGVHLTFDKQATWPEVPFGTGSLQYTLWILLNIGGQWYGAGVMQYWKGLAAQGGNVTLNNQIATNWVYAPRWGPMQGHQPVAGETVGFMVTQGNARGVDDHTVTERSPIAWVLWPVTTPQTYPPFAPAP